MSADIKEVISDRAPSAIGPYSQGILTRGGLIFVSGQLPLDPGTGELVKGDISILTNRVIDNLEAILKDADCGLAEVVKVEIFMTNLQHFAAMNKVYEQRFKHKPYPARQTIQVAALPRNAEIEISCIAQLRDPIGKV